LALACILSWAGTRALGRQKRIDARLSADHELVTHGPYRVVRHPIYTSMLCRIGAVCLVAGTEIRVRIEEKLLAARFGEQYAEYRRRVPAYVPFAR
jgi:protein-S-isoprenylcysteine O-methyltransferase Ste14